MFITFEGIDGAGVSTQARLLKEMLEVDGHQVVLTREPGGSPGAEEIRGLMLQSDPDRWSPVTEVLLRATGRRDHLERTIRPALEARKIVVCDRFVDFDRVQTSLRALDMRRSVDLLHSHFVTIEPNLSFLIDADPEVVHQRMSSGSGPDMFGKELFIAERQAYLDLAAEFPDRFRVIDGNQSTADVHQSVLSQVEALLPVLQD